MVDVIAPPALFVIMEHTEASSPVPFFHTLTAYQNTGALKLDLFIAIGENGAIAAELATRCNGAERGARIL